MQTGRSTLPTTIAEYNQALQEAMSECLAESSPEGRLLAHILEGSLLTDEEGSDGRGSSPANSIPQTITPEPVLFLKDHNTGRIKFTAFGLEQYQEEFSRAGIQIEQIQSEAELERAQLNSIRHSTVELMVKLLDYPELKAAFEPFATSLKAQLKRTKEQ